MRVDITPLPINPEMVECSASITPHLEIDVDSKRRFIAVISEMPNIVPVALRCIICPARDLKFEGPKLAIAILPDDSIEVRMSCEKGQHYIVNPSSSLSLNHAQLPCADPKNFDLEIRGINYLPKAMESLT